MHLFFIFIIIVVFFLIIRHFKSDQLPIASAKSEASENITQHLEPVYISDGKLFTYSSSGKTIQIESAYIEDMRERQEKSKQLAGWKEGTTWDTSFAQMSGMGERHEEGIIQFSSVTRSNSRKLLYCLKGAGFGGLFEFCFDTKKEKRLMHRQNLDFRDLSRPNADGQVLCCSVQQGGNADITMMKANESSYKDLTAGDTIDTAPSWVWDQPNHIVYQSQGIARDIEGYIKGVSPSEIILLNTQSGELKIIFSSNDTDYLKPQVSQNGNLYFITRPYESNEYSRSSAALDALFFPFRLLRAVFHYLNFFSLLYSRKPLTSANGPQVRKDAKDVILQGRRIDTEKALRKGTHANGMPSLVPANWVLMRCDKQGNQEILATHVASYSLGEDDNIIYSNGCGIFYITPEGKHEKVLQEKLIEDILM